MTSDQHSSAVPPTNPGDPLTSEYRKKLASDLSNAENGKRLILSVIGVFLALFIARALGFGFLGCVILYGIMLFLIWGLHRRFIQTHYLKASDTQLLHEHRTRRGSTGLAFGCLGGMFAATVVVVSAAVVVAVLLAATSPDEPKLRSAVFGQLGRGFEWILDVSRPLGGPKLVYHDYIVGSVLAIDYGKGAEPDVLAFGACGRVWVTEDVKKLHDLSAPFSR